MCMRKMMERANTVLNRVILKNKNKKTRLYSICSVPKAEEGKCIQQVYEAGHLSREKQHPLPPPPPQQEC